MTTDERLAAEQAGARRVAAGCTLLVAVLLLAPFPMGLNRGSLHLLSRLHFDKLLHAALFFGLAWAWLRGPAGASRSRVAAGITLAIALYGGLLELVQPRFGRDADWGDFTADAAGSLLAWARSRVVAPPGGAL